MVESTTLKNQKYIKVHYNIVQQNRTKEKKF